MVLMVLILRSSAYASLLLMSLGDGWQVTLWQAGVFNNCNLKFTVLPFMRLRFSLTTTSTC